tara:strand:- start:1261 stop:2181 length:921 start_codon:yes stop_codon:yes gene_type:complete
MKTKNKQTKFSSFLPKERLPSWIKPSLGKASQLEKVQKLVKEQKLHTICEEGRCPNRGECYAAGTATFLLGGSICTRSCAFCQVHKGKPIETPNQIEANRVAFAVQQLNLRYVVITSVARDDLPDHGASIFKDTMRAIREILPKIDIEVLTPDFWGVINKELDPYQTQKDRLKIILDEKPICFNHNLETVERLQREVRRGATYSRSLGLLKAAKEIEPEIPTKSGLMLGLGESKEEIIQSLKDLRNVDCNQITIGQYLRPSLAHIPVQKYWMPKDFELFGSIAKELGFEKINSGPLVRSSYHAAEK